MTFNSSVWKLNLQRIGIAFIFCCAVISTFYNPGKVAAVANPLDLTFGTSGTVITQIGSYETVANDVVVQPDGKYIVAGHTQTGSSSPDFFTVVRYNSNGSLDTTFDGDGIVSAQFSATGSYESSIAYSVKIQPDGKIVVAGNSFTSTGSAFTSDFGVARLNPNGSFDTTFDGDGKTTVSFGLQYNISPELEIQSDGKIVLAGMAQPDQVRGYPAIARLNANGSLDTTFSEDGKISFNTDLAYSNRLLLQPDGKVLIAFYYDLLTLVRVNADGSPDATFGTNGRSVIPFAQAASLAVQPADGKILIGGNASTQTTGYDFRLTRVNPNGSIDETFGNNGTTLVNFSTYADSLFDIAIQPDGKIVAAGYSDPSIEFTDDFDFAVARLNSNGSLDTTFDDGGKTLTKVGERSSAVRAVAVERNGKIIAVGSQYLGGVIGRGNAALVRYMGDLNTADFDGDTKTDVSVFRPSTGTWYLAENANGYSAFNFGTAEDKLVPGDYTGDGRTDIAVFRPSTGIWHILRSENSSYQFVRFGSVGDVPVPADYDGDGRTDISVFRPSTGIWYRTNSLSNSFSAVQFGGAEDKPVAGDFDGDGRSDINVFRPSNGGWYRLNSSDNQFISAQFGASADIPVSADFDGDSRSDIAVFRSSNGTWYWMRSSNGGILAIQWGQSGDTPVAGDYDGDGRTDIVVFRTSAGAWYLNRSTAGFAGIQFGQNGDVPIPNSFIR